MFARFTTLTLVSLAAAGALTRAPSPAPLITAAARTDELDRVNSQSRVTWEVTLGAGETASLAYEFSVFR